MLKKSKNAHPEIITHISLNTALFSSSKPQPLTNPGTASEEKTEHKANSLKNITVI